MIKVVVPRKKSFEYTVRISSRNLLFDLAAHILSVERANFHSLSVQNLPYRYKSNVENTDGDVPGYKRYILPQHF